MRLTAIAVATLAVIGLAGWLLWPSPPAAATVSGGTSRYVVNATIDPPRMGDAEVTIDLTGRARSAQVATVSVEAVMPLMGFATPALPAATTSKSGHYLVSGVPLMMTGPWELRVSIAEEGGGTDDLTLPFTVSG
ncbi:MAG TPA: hypothetical protein VGM75_14230 [Pseudonocardiaceae bacterium]|jgi:hypothetical protein